MYANVHGRRSGRGTRPCLIVAKALGVATFTGGLATLFLTVFVKGLPADATGWREQLGLIRDVFTRAVVPALIWTLSCGVLLAASIWRVMIRMRWFGLKMALIAVCVPGLHLFMSSRVRALRAVLNASTPDLQSAAFLWHELLVGTIAALVFAVVVIVLGRVKPRLGQDYARTFSRHDKRSGGVGSQA